jgi:hypothetical protein
MCIQLQTLEGALSLFLILLENIYECQIFCYYDLSLF